MQTTDPLKPADDQQADELVQMLDRLMQSGTQHINLTVGDETRIRTVNSTDCSGRPGACAQPNADLGDEDGIL